MKFSLLRFSVVFAILLAAVFTVQARPTGQPADTPRADRIAPRVTAQEPLPAQEPSEKKMSPREVKVMRGNIYLARKMYVEATAVFLDVLRDEPRNADLLNRVGVAYHQQGRFGDAKKYYKRAIKADKNFAIAYNNVGMVEFHRKNNKGALKEFARAIKLDPTVASYHHNMFHAYWTMKDYGHALLSFQKAVTLDPQVFERRGSGVGSVLQSVPVEERAAYYFFLAKSYAVVGDAERCAGYLAKARDEGYAEMASVQKDPVFAGVLAHPLVQQVLDSHPVARNPQK